jgi:murein DD-endopeptidase MepM/ murein hydrolase activator NlpD
MTNTVNNASYSAAFQSIMQLMLLPVTDAYGKRVYPHVTNNGDNTVNDYWYPNPLATPAIHAGIDFNYVGGQGPANPANTLPVFSPVTGVVVRTQLEYGGVIIQAADGTYHRILHLDAMNLVEGNSVTAGVTQLGLMSNLGAVTAGQYSGPVHVHYDIFLESK